VHWSHGEASRPRRGWRRCSTLSRSATPTPTGAGACWSASTSRSASAQSATATTTTPPRRRGPRSTGPDGSCPHPDLAGQHPSGAPPVVRRGRSVAVGSSCVNVCSTTLRTCGSGKDTTLNVAGRSRHRLSSVRSSSASTSHQQTRWLPTSNPASARTAPGSGASCSSSGNCALGRSGGGGVATSTFDVLRLPTHRRPVGLMFLACGAGGSRVGLLWSSRRTLTFRR
jgi:hypothetical protein